MKYKVIFFIFIILMSCTTVSNIKDKKEGIQEKDKEPVKPEIDEVKIPEKKKSDNTLLADRDIEEKIEEKKSLVNINKNKKNNIALNKSKISNENIKLEDNNDYKIKEYELKEVNVESGKALYISLKYPDWIIKSISSNQIRLTRNVNYQDNSLFQFKTYTPATVNIIFVRSDEINKLFLRQPYRINVLPKTALQGNEETGNKQNEIEKKVNNKESNDRSSKEKIKLDEEPYKSMKQLADKYFQEGNYKDAKLIYLKLLEEGITDPEILYKLGIIEKDNINKSKAYEYFNAALEDKGSDYSVYSLIELLRLLKEQKKYKDALDIYFKYGLIDNLDKKIAEDLDILLCDLYFCLNDFLKAANEYKRFIKDFPYSDYYAKALFYLAYSLENLPINPDFKEAYRIYEIIIDRFADTKYFLLSKKRLLYLDRHYLKIH